LLSNNTLVTHVNIFSKIVLQRVTYISTTVKPYASFTLLKHHIKVRTHDTIFRPIFHPILPFDKIRILRTHRSNVERGIVCRCRTTFIRQFDKIRFMRTAK